MIRITTWGSLPGRDKNFGPADNGHAQLVLEAIDWLVNEVLADAIAQDHQLHTDGNNPPHGWPQRLPRTTEEVLSDITERELEGDT